MKSLSVFASKQATFWSPLTPNDCEARLKPVLKKPLVTMPGAKEPLGEVRPGGAKIWTPMTHRLAVVTDLIATFESAEGGTLVRCRSNGSPYDMILGSAYMGVFLAVLSGLLVRGALNDQGWLVRDWVPFVYLPVAALGIGLAYASLRRRSARGDHDRLVGFLSAQLNGQSARSQP